MGYVILGIDGLLMVINGKYTWEYQSPGEININGDINRKYMEIPSDHESCSLLSKPRPSPNSEFSQS